MHFQHSCEIWDEFPELVAAAVFVEGVDKIEGISKDFDKFLAVANRRLIGVTEGESGALIVPPAITPQSVLP